MTEKREILDAFNEGERRQSDNFHEHVMDEVKVLIDKKRRSALAG